MIFALIGNPNCGKTTLFNLLTGGRQHVGNFPGVTVDKKVGQIRKYEYMSVVDLPGIYSLSPYSAEEIVTEDYLSSDEPDAIINIVDVTNIERNLYLTLQLMELNKPMVVALNMMDQLTENGGNVDVKLMSDMLGVPVVPISAFRNHGIDKLIHIAEQVVRNHELPEKMSEYSRNIRPEGTTYEASGYRSALDQEAALADARYKYIEKIVAASVVKPLRSREKQRSKSMDKVLTHRLFAIPIFMEIMMLIFWVTFGPIGAALSNCFAMGVDAIIGALDTCIQQMEIDQQLRSLLVDGVFAGVGSVLSFLPTIVLLFLQLSLLEDSGYMARVVFVMDKFLRGMGLTGRSFVPMLIGFGCSVPAIMAARTLPSSRDRKITVLLTPFMSCSAKLPIYATLAGAFFTEWKALTIFSIYILGIAVGILAGYIMNSFVFSGRPAPFVMELPDYRLPTAGSVLIHMWEKSRDFMKKAFTVIFVATVIIWLLQNFDMNFNAVSDSSESIIAEIGYLISPLLAPIGLGDWRVATALMTGFSAKEAVISTLTVLLSSGSGTMSAAMPAVLPETGVAAYMDLETMLQGIMSPLQAYCFMVFCLLYTPCVATIAAARKELGGMRYALLIIVFQTGVAWAVTFVVYNIGLNL